MNAPIMSPPNSRSPQKASPLPPESHGAIAQSAVPKSMVTILEERINMYKQASNNAKTAGDSSKARRLDRGLKVRASIRNSFLG